MMGLLARLREDMQTVKDRDPAARNGTLEILLTTPGLHAQWAYRIAHALWLRRVPLLPRLISHYTRFLTGIEIHPGATIGRRFFIDHGMGIVIGETAEIGDDVSLFQGVTLGGTGKETGKRHPTLKHGVTVGVGAHVLGAVTVGEGARVGGGAVVLRDVPPNTTAVGVPAHATTRLQPNEAAESGRRVHRIADPAQEQIDALRRQVAELNARLAALEDHHPVVPGGHAPTNGHHKRPRIAEPTPTSASDCK
jgi:serine O-acetyltransferase